MKLEGRVKNITYDFKQKGTQIEFMVPGNIVSTIEGLVDSQVNLSINKSTGKRTTNANAYLWVLLGELQEKLRVPKEDIYKEYIKDCGVYDIYCMQDQAVEAFIECWEGQGLGWVCQKLDSKLDGCTNILAYRGTSAYDKSQMAILLNQVVEDCIAQEIPTKPREDIDSLIESWK